MKSCVRCGYCCIKCPCVFAQILHYFIDFKERCPYLRWDGKGYECMVMKNFKTKKEQTTREYLIEVMVNELLVGECENPRNGYRKDIKER